MNVCMYIHDSQKAILTLHYYMILYRRVSCRLCAVPFFPDLRMENGAGGTQGMQKARVTSGNSLFSSSLYSASLSIGIGDELDPSNKGLVIVHTHIHTCDGMTRSPLAS